MMMMVRQALTTKKIKKLVALWEQLSIVIFGPGSFLHDHRASLTALKMMPFASGGGNSDVGVGKMAAGVVGNQRVLARALSK